MLPVITTHDALMLLSIVTKNRHAKSGAIRHGFKEDEILNLGLL